MDLSIARWITETLGSNKALAIFWRIVTTFGSKWGVLAIVVFLLLFKKTRKIGIYALFACGAVFVLNDWILKSIIKRARPFVQDPELETMCRLAGLELPDGYSMPSGHSAISMAIAMSIMCFSKKWGGISLLYPFMVGLSRIFLCVHFTTDVLVGWVLGIFIAIAVHFVLNLLIKFYLSKKGDKNEKISTSVNEQTQG